MNILQKNSKKVLLLTILFLFAFYFLLPLYWIAISSTKSLSDIFGTFGFWFAEDFNLLENIRGVLTYNEGIFVRWFINSLIFCGGAAALGSITSTFAGYAFTQYEFPARRKLFFLILGGLFIPITALALPIFLVMSELGWVNTYRAFILPSAATPFGVYFMVSYCKGSIPDNILDAARIDGASELQVFTKVVFKIITPGFATLFLILFVLTWNNYFLPLIVLNQSELYPATVGLAHWTALADAGREVLFHLVVTGSAISIIPLILLFLYLQKFWKKGMTLGSSK